MLLLRLLAHTHTHKDTHTHTQPSGWQTDWQRWRCVASFFMCSNRTTVRMINARHWQNCISGSQLSATPPLSPSLPVSLCHPHFKQISLAAKKLGFALSSSWGFLLSVSRVESRKDNRTFCLFSSLLSVLFACTVLFFFALQADAIYV